MTSEERIIIDRLERDVQKLRWRSTFALGIAVVLLVGWCLSSAWNVLFAQTLQLHADGLNQAYVRLWDEKSILGVLVDHYGDLEFRFVAKNNTNRSVIKLDEEGVTVTLSKDQIPLAEWKLTAEGEQFKKLNNQWC